VRSRIVYNASLAITNVALGAEKYCDSQGRRVIGKTALQPFASKILIAAEVDTPRHRTSEVIMQGGDETMEVARDIAEPAMSRPFQGTPYSGTNAPTRERARDRIVHLEAGIVRDVPQVPRLCESLDLKKEKVAIGECMLHCEQEGEGLPVVLINGGPSGTHHCFHPHFSRAKDFAQIIYYDQRGCGLSDYESGKGYTVNQAVEDLD
jgi:hypothetical protein